MRAANHIGLLLSLGLLFGHAGVCTDARSVCLLCCQAVAKARFEVESYKVYIRNRDRQLCKYIRKMPWPRSIKSKVKQIEQILEMN